MIMASGIIPPGSEHAAVLHALVRRRAEIGAEIERCRARLRDLQGSAEHVEATIRLFNSDVRVEAIRPKRAAPTHGGAYGEITQAMMETLHDADYPLTSRELAAAVVSRRGLDGSDRELELVMAKRVRACLRPHRLKGRVRSVDIGEGPQPTQHHHAPSAENPSDRSYSANSSLPAG